MANTKYGWVWVMGQQRPFTKYTEIEKGRNKGKIKVFFAAGTAIVRRDNIKVWPEEE